MKKEIKKEELKLKEVVQWIIRNYKDEEGDALNTLKSLVDGLMLVRKAQEAANPLFNKW